MQNITPILAMEILADLLKAHDSGGEPQEWVRSLALKFGGSGETVNMEFIHLVAGDLAGNKVPMTRQIIADNARLAPDPGGGTAMLVDLGPFNHAFMRWAAGRFTPADLEIARRWRLRGPNLGQDALWTALKERGVTLPRPRGKVTEIIDEVLDRDDLQPIWLDYMLNQIEATERFRPIVYDKVCYRGSSPSCGGPLPGICVTRESTPCGQTTAAGCPCLALPSPCSGQGAYCSGSDEPGQCWLCKLPQ